MDSIEYYGDGSPYTIYRERSEDQTPIGMFLVVEVDKN